MYVLNANNDSIYYVHTDNLGSIIALSDKLGNLISEFSYDARGNMRNASVWSKTNVNQQLPFDRGYTGHEHLQNFALINMNGRLYDPLLGRMLSPDTIVQYPGSTQSYNRYSYVFNNPLKYTDPTGCMVDDYFDQLCGEYDAEIVFNVAMNRCTIDEAIQIFLIKYGYQNSYSGNRSNGGGGGDGWSSFESFNMFESSDYGFDDMSNDRVQFGYKGSYDERSTYVRNGEYNLKLRGGALGYWVTTVHA